MKAAAAKYEEEQAKVKADKEEKISKLRESAADAAARVIQQMYYVFSVSIRCVGICWNELRCNVLLFLFWLMFLFLFLFVFSFLSLSLSSSLSWPLSLSLSLPLSLSLSLSLSVFLFLFLFLLLLSFLFLLLSFFFLVGCTPTYV